jgi:hypothetical protein
VLVGGLQLQQQARVLQRGGGGEALRGGSQPADELAGEAAVRDVLAGHDRAPLGGGA